jgi:hypothetical protein
MLYFVPTALVPSGTVYSKSVKVELKCVKNKIPYFNLYYNTLDSLQQ